MKWFCTNCCGIVEDVGWWSRSDADCPHCETAELISLSGNALWARNRAKEFGIDCTIAVSQGDHKTLKTSGYGLVDEGSCAAIVALWIKCYHGRMNDRATALAAFIKLLDEDVGLVSARQIQMSTKAVTIVHYKQKWQTAKQDFDDLGIETTTLMSDASTLLPDQIGAFRIRMALHKQKILDTRTVMNSALQTLQEADRQRDLLQSGDVGVHENRDYTRLQLNTAMDYMLGRTGYYSMSIDNPNGSGHRLGFITAAGKFMFLDPNTGEFRTSSRSKLKQAVNAHFAALYVGYTNDIKVLVTL